MTGAPKHIVDEEYAGRVQRAIMDAVNRASLLPDGETVFLKPPEIQLALVGAMAALAAATTRELKEDEIKVFLHDVGLNFRAVLARGHALHVKNNDFIEIMTIQ